MQTFQPPGKAINMRALGPKIVVEHPEIRCYAELGSLYGGTLCRVAQAMAPDGEIHAFDFEDMLKLVKENLVTQGVEKRHKYLWHPNTRKTKDSYCWSLLRLLKICDMHKVDRRMFDYVFIDGAHTFDVDGFAFLLIDLMLKPGGFVEFDDYRWTLMRSPTMSPAVFPTMGEWYTEEQLTTPNVGVIVDTLVEAGGGYETVVKERLYRKR